MNSITIKRFNKEHTTYCKGIAIILLVIHHLFWNVPNIGYEIRGVALSQRIGIIGKVCVAIFLLLSGIGIYESTKEKFLIKSFYVKYIVRIYANYIFIVLISSLIGVIFFNSIFKEMLPYEGVKGIVYYLLTCSGIQYIFGYQGFNGAWWFISLILLCYISFPIIKKQIEKNSYRFLIISFIISLLDIIPLGRIKIFELLAWMFVFILGVFIAHNNFLFKFKNYVLSKKYRIGNLIIILIILLIIRQEIEAQGFIAMKYDYLLSIIIVESLYIFYERLNFGKAIIIVLGKHSMNIFFVHMFFTTYYLKQFTYKFKYPLIIVIFVIVSSLICSFIIEKLKYLINYKYLIKYIENYISSFKIYDKKDI